MLVTTHIYINIGVLNRNMLLLLLLVVCAYSEDVCACHFHLGMQTVRRWPPHESRMMM